MVRMDELMQGIMNESLRLWLEDENGEEWEYELFGTFGLDGKDYMALLPVSEEEEPDREVLLYGFHAGPEDEIILDPIEDGEELERAAQAFEDIFNGGLEGYDEVALYEESEEEARRLTELLELPELGLVEEAAGETSAAFQGLWADEEEEDSGDWCYEDADGNLFLYGENGEIIYLNEYGEPIEAEKRGEN